jgi:hypothetical protein
MEANILTKNSSVSRRWSTSKLHGIIDITMEIEIIALSSLRKKMRARCKYPNFGLLERSSSDLRVRARLCLR